MTGYFKMTRRGTFKPSTSTHNQCKVMGFSEYLYEIVMVFTDSTPLDENGFFIDHANIDNAIQMGDISGSCEEMHPKIYRAVMDAFKNEHQPMQRYPVAYKCVIKPSNQPEAYMEYTQSLNQKYLKYL